MAILPKLLLPPVGSKAMALSFLTKGLDFSPLQGEWLWPHAYRLMRFLSLKHSFLSLSLSYDYLLSGLLPADFNFNSVRPFTGLAPSIQDFTTYCLCLCFTLQDHCLYRPCFWSLNHSTDSYFSWPIAWIFQCISLPLRLTSYRDAPSLLVITSSLLHSISRRIVLTSDYYNHSLFIHNQQTYRAQPQDHCSFQEHFTSIKYRISKTKSLSSFYSSLSLHLGGAYLPSDSITELWCCNAYR